MGRGPVAVKRGKGALVKALDHFSAGRFAEAERFCQRVSPGQRDWTDARNLFGVIALSRGRLEEAVTVFTDLLVQTPALAQVRCNLGLTLRRLGRLQQAEDELREAVRLSPDLPAARLNFALVLADRGDFSEAEIQFSQLLAYEPANMDALLNLALLRRRASDWNAAIELYRRVLTLDPVAMAGHLGLAAALVDAGRVDEAAEIYNQILENTPNHPEALYNLGVLNERGGRTGIAQQLYERALSLRPDMQEALLNLGNIQLKRGRPADAFALYWRLAGIDKTGTPAHVGIGNALYALARTGEGALVKTEAARWKARFPEMAIACHMADALSGHAQDDASNYARQMFDAFADSFDKTLIAIGYSVPDRFAEKLAVWYGAEGDAALDICDVGCGTGLCGSALRPWAKRLVGIDISSRMLAHAAERGVYDQLHEGAVVEALQNYSQCFDIVTAGDVMIYLGDLSPVVSAMANALRQDGHAIFNVEVMEDGAFTLGQHGRFSHSRSHVLDVLAQAGLKADGIEEFVVRNEFGLPVNGLLIAAHKGQCLTTAQALELHRQGQVDAASRAYAQILRATPDDMDALYLLSLIQLQRGQWQMAADGLAKVAQKFAGNGEVLCNLGIALARLGDSAAAAQHYDRALAIHPGMVEAHLNYGLLLLSQARAEDAERHFRHALQGGPRADVSMELGNALMAQGRYAEAAEAFGQGVVPGGGQATALYNLGVALARAGRPAEAGDALARAIAAAPDLACAHHMSGVVLDELGQPEAAVAALRRALQLRPDFAAAWVNLAWLLCRCGDLAAAEDAARQGVDFAPSLAQAHYNLGLVLQSQGRSAEAEAAYGQALALQGDDARAFNNLGVVLVAQGRHGEARDAYGKALAIAPEEAQYHYNFGQALIAVGQLAEGWSECEWRWKTPAFLPHIRSLPSPLWRGEKLPVGKTLAIWREQGVGDELMFVSTVPELVAAGANVVLECSERLVPLFARSLPGVEIVPVQAQPHPRLSAPDVAAQVPMGDLPRWLRPDLASFAGRGGRYLVPCPDLVAACRHRLGPGMRVGVSWRTTSSAERSIPLDLWAPLLARHDVTFVSLQYGDVAADIASVEGRVLVDPAVDALADLDAFAAQVAAMDLVITIDNVTAHFAGALGVPAIVLLPFNPDWRWMVEGQGSHWWPTLRLLRQNVPGEWRPVLKQAQRVVEEFCHN